jgi:hypothetical protein
MLGAHAPERIATAFLKEHHVSALDWTLVKARIGNAKRHARSLEEFKSMLDFAGCSPNPEELKSRVCDSMERTYKGTIDFLKAHLADNRGVLDQSDGRVLLILMVGRASNSPWVKALADVALGHEVDFVYPLEDPECPSPVLTGLRHLLLHPMDYRDTIADHTIFLSNDDPGGGPDAAQKQAVCRPICLWRKARSYWRSDVAKSSIPSTYTDWDSKQGIGFQLTVIPTPEDDWKNNKVLSMNLTVYTVKPGVDWLYHDDSADKDVWERAEKSSLVCLDDKGELTVSLSFSREDMPKNTTVVVYALQAANLMNFVLVWSRTCHRNVQLITARRMECHQVLHQDSSFTDEATKLVPDGSLCCKWVTGPVVTHASN